MRKNKQKTLTILWYNESRKGKGWMMNLERHRVPILKNPIKYKNHIGNRSTKVVGKACVDLIWRQDACVMGRNGVWPWGDHKSREKRWEPETATKRRKEKEKSSKENQTRPVRNKAGDIRVPKITQVVSGHLTVSNLEYLKYNFSLVSKIIADIKYLYFFSEIHLHNKMSVV